MKLSVIPLFEHLAASRIVIVAGIGGGYDVFSGLPLYFALREAGKTVHLANLSFTQLDAVTGRSLAPAHREVSHESTSPLTYFPERHLCAWFRERGESVVVHGFKKTGVKHLAAAWETLASELNTDAIVAVDGGTDSLMRGDEQGLGTPAEDMASLAAIAPLDVPTKLLACIGFGIDAYHGVSHYRFLENAAALAREGAFLGAFSLLREMREAQLFVEASRYVFDRMRGAESVVASSIVAAVEGRFGDHHETARTDGTELFINPLVATYWSFDLVAVARRNLFLDDLRETDSWGEVSRIIEGLHDGIRLPRESVPLPI